MKFALKWGTGLAFLSFTVLCISVNGAEIKPAISTANDDELIYVQQRVSADYEKSPEKLARVLSAPLETVVSIRLGDTLSGVISKTYSIGKSNAAKAYSQLEAHIVKRNSIADPNQLPAETELIIPDIPVLAKVYPNPSNSKNKIAKISVAQQLTLENRGQLLGDQVADYKNFRLLDKGRIGAAEVVQLRVMTRKEARELITGGSYGVNVMNAKVKIKLAVDNGAKLSSALSPEDEALIKQKLSGVQLKRPTLIILDDGWPDSKAFSDSKAFLIDAISRIRKKYGMDLPSIPKNLVDTNQLEYTTPSPISCVHQNAYKAPMHNHSAMIERAILPFQLLETQPRVKVIYIPMFTAQNGSCDILRELIEINLNARHMKAQLGDPVPNDVQKLSRNMAIQILKGVSNSLDADVMQTDQAVIEAVFNFSRLYAEMTNEPCFLNMSWTVPNLEFEPFIPPDAFGLAVVAAGNDGDSQGTTVYQSKSQFAFRSRFPGDMLAVMNVNDDGAPSCGSSLLDVKPDVYGFSFPGAISETECGTSFSAPRVAWLIAARESMLPKLSTVQDWISQLKQDLTSMHNMDAQGFNRIKLSIPKLFTQVPNP